MLPRRPACNASPWSRMWSSWYTTIDRPRVARTIACRSVKSGLARSVRAPSRPSVRTASSQIAATSGSTGSRPSRSGVNATRHRRSTASRTAAAYAGDIDVVRQRIAVVGPGASPTASARSRRRCGPSARSRSRPSNGSAAGSCGTSPAVVRKPTTPQNAAGVRSEPPRSEPSHERAHARRQRDRRAAGRAAARERRVPGVAGGAEDVVEGVGAGAELGRVRLADDDRARVASRSTSSASTSGTLSA